MVKNFNLKNSIAIICMIGVVVFVASCSSFSFKDVSVDSFYYDDVKTACESGIMTGESKESFAPNETVTYADILEIAAKLHHVKNNSDDLIEKNATYNDYSTYCISHGIISEEYSMNDVVTRATCIDILSRTVIDSELKEINRVDDGMIHDIDENYGFYDVIYKAYRAGIFNGVAAVFNCEPEGDIKRYEVAGLVSRLLNSENRLEVSLVKIESSSSKDDETDDVDFNDILIMRTPIGDFYYPGRWFGKINSNTLPSKNGYISEIYGVTDSGSAKLYTLYIGDSQKNSTVVGSVNNLIISYKLEDLESLGWYGADKNDIIEMQNDVNYIIDQIKKLTGFTVAMPENDENTQTPESEKNTEVNDKEPKQPSQDDNVCEPYDNVNENKEPSFVVENDKTQEPQDDVDLNDNTDNSENKEPAQESDNSDLEDVTVPEDNNSQNQNISSDNSDNTVNTVYQDFVLLNTPVGKLKYPGKWTNNVYAQSLSVGEGYAAEVFGTTSSGIAKVFTIYIGVEFSNGEIVGYLNNKEICIDTESLSVDNWSANDKAEILEIQADLDFIIKQLKLISGFKTSITMPDAEVDDSGKKPADDDYEDDKQEDDNNDNVSEEIFEDFVLLNTPIGELYYPGVWTNKVSAKTISVNQGYAAEVYAETNSGKVKVYTIYIGTGMTGGFTVGYVDGEEVRVDMYDIEVSGMTEDEKTIVYGVQEDLNYLFEQITDIDGYSDTVQLPNDNKPDFLLLDTPIGELYYHGVWTNKVSAKTISVNQGYAAEVYAETNSGKVKVYTIYIGTGMTGGFTVGSVDGEEVRVDMYDVEVSGMTEDEKTIVYGVQEDLNYLFEQITDMDGYSF